MAGGPDRSEKSGALRAVLDALSRVKDSWDISLSIAGRLALAIWRVTRRRLARLVSRVLSARRRMISERAIWRFSGSVMGGTSKGCGQPYGRAGGGWGGGRKQNCSPRRAGEPQRRPVGWSVMAGWTGYGHGDFLHFVPFSTRCARA